MSKASAFSENIAIYCLIASSILLVIAAKYFSFGTAIKLFVLPFIAVYGAFISVFAAIMAVIFIAWFMGKNKVKE